MKKFILLLSFVLLTVTLSAQTQILKKNFELKKGLPTLYFTGTTPAINFNNGEVVITNTNANLLTISGGNLVVPNTLPGYSTTATAAGTTTLTVASNFLQYFTGSTTQTVKLPVTSTLSLGQEFLIVNNSTGLVTINSSGSNAVVILGAGTSAKVTCILLSGTTAASWNSSYLGIGITSGKKLSASNTLTLAGTDGTTMTFPTTSATIARTDVANTFTGNQTIGGVTMTGATGTGNLVFSANPTFTGTVTIPTPFTLGAVSVLPTGTELNFVKDVTSAIQTQLGNKQPLHASLTSIAGLTEAAGTLIYGTADNTYAVLAAGATTTILVGNGAAAPVWTTATGTGAPVRAGSPTFTGITTVAGLAFATSSTHIWTAGGSVVLATAGTDAACSDGARYWSEIMIPYNITITGISYLIGSVGATDSVVVQLVNSAGAQVATSRAVGGAAAIVGTAANFQGVPFTSTYAATAGLYYVVVQFNGTTAKFRTYPIPGSKFIAGSVAGTWGTAAGITPGTTFTADKGPICITY